MTTRATIAATAYAVMLALTLAACGSESAKTATTANITFKTDPAAEVWIDGKNAGMSPVVIAVDAGSHDVVLKAAGFKNERARIDVEAGKDITVEAGLTLDGTDVAAYKRLLAGLGIEHEPAGEVRVHRGAGTPPVMIYWPRGKMRLSAISTYRFEVTPDYENDAYVEFRKGSKVLHREPFIANDLVMEKVIPGTVLEAISKRGGTYRVVLNFDSKRKKDIVAEFTVDRTKKVDKLLAKIRKRQVYRRANPLMRQLAEIERLQNVRHYAEALSRSLSVVNTWPDTEMPFKNIAACCERLKLKETQLYQDVAAQLRGSGASKLRPGLNPGARSTGDAGTGQGNGLPPSVVAPRVREDKGSGFGKSGMGVTPTPEAQKRQPGPIEDTPGGGAGTDSDATGTDATGTDSTGLPAGRTGDARPNPELDQLKAELAAAEEGAGHVDDAMQRALDAQKELEKFQGYEQTMQEKLADANKAVKDLEQKELDTPGSVTAAELKSAKEAAAEADRLRGQVQGQVAEAEKAATEARNASSDLISKVGTQADNAVKIQELKNRIEETESADVVGKTTPGTDTSGTGLPGTIVPGAGLPGTGLPGVVPGIDPATGKPIDPNAKDPESVQHQIESARQGLQSLMDSLNRDQQELKDVSLAAEQAAKVAADAEARLEAAIAAGKPQTEIDAIETEISQAIAEKARAQMEAARVQGAIDRNQARNAESVAEARRLVEEAEAAERAGK